MGLVVEVIPQHVPDGRVCTDGSSSSMDEDTVSLDKSIYRIFSMQSDMKTLTLPAAARNEFELFVIEASKKTDLEAYNPAFDSLDTYIGTIGVSNGIC